MMEIGIGGTDALDWDIFLRGHGRRQMSKSEEVAAKINCSCDSQNTTRPAETKSKDFPFCRYFRKKAFNPWISHPNENKKVYDFLQVGEGLLIIFLACSNFWKRKHFFIQIFKLCWGQKNAQNYYFEWFWIISRWSSITEAATSLTAFLLLILPSGQKSHCYLLFTFYLNYFWLPNHL